MSAVVTCTVRRPRSLGCWKGRSGSGCGGGGGVPHCPGSFRIYSVCWPHLMLQFKGASRSPISYGRGRSQLSNPAPSRSERACLWQEAHVSCVISDAPLCWLVAGRLVAFPPAELAMGFLSGLALESPCSMSAPSLTLLRFQLLVKVLV